MQKIKIYITSLGINIALILIFSLFLNLFNYFEILNTNIYKVLLITLIGISSLTGGFYLGINSNEKGYLKGLIYGIITCIILITLSIILNANLTTSSILYYLIIIIISSISSIIGINKKKEKNN